MSDKELTIHDIARESGVSSTTVSRYLNGSSMVRVGTGERVQAVIDRFNYKPNYIAKQLSLQRSNTLGLIVPDITNMYFAEVVQAIERAAAEKDVAVIINNTLSDFDLEKKHLLDLVNRRMDGLVLLGGSTNEVILSDDKRELFRRALADTPVVLIDGRIEGVKGLEIRFNNDAAMDGIVNYLIDHGHTDIALAGGLSGVSTYEEKLMHYSRYMTARGLEGSIRTAPRGFSVGSGKEALEDLSRFGAMPTAIICINDLVAAGVIRTCSDRGILIPEDLSIIAFDNTELSDVLVPALSSVGPNYAELGRITVDYLTGDSTEGREVIVDLEFSNRASAGPADVQQKLFGETC